MIKLEDIKVGAKVKHIGDKNSLYIITDTCAIAKFNGKWQHCICYAPEYNNNYTRFIRDVDDFMYNFELIKE